MKVSLRIVSLVLTIFLFIGTFSTAIHGATAMKTGVAWIEADYLRLRSGPSTSSNTVTYGQKGDVAVLLGKTGKWYHVSYNLQEGYMHEDYLSVMTKENVELGYGKVLGSNVNVRSGPSTSNAKVAVANSGDRVYILGINNGWFRVIFSDTIGYIRSDYVSLTEIPYDNAASNHSPIFYENGKSTGVTVHPSALKADVSKIVTTAKGLIGTPYVWGGMTPAGFDCSGYVQYVFAANGVQLKRTSAQQYSMGTWVDRSKLQVGDLVFFNTSGKGVSHCGIYLGSGQFIHCSSSKGVTISNMSNSYWSSRYMGARRVL